MVRENQILIDHADDEYCCRSCDRHFNTRHGVLQHCQYATCHQKEWCERCERLFVSPAARDAHRSKSSHHNHCHDCQLDFPTSSGLQEHDVSVHNMCAQCGNYFSNQNNLAQHQRVHLPQDIECLGCYRDFSEFSAMILHLESGNCASGVELFDLETWIFDDVFCRRYTTDQDAYYKYRCSDCGHAFRYLSGLLQHAASNACDEEVEEIVVPMKRCISNSI